VLYVDYKCNTSHFLLVFDRMCHYLEKTSCLFIFLFNNEDSSIKCPCSTSNFSRYLILNVGFLISSPLLGWESLSISLLFSIKKNKNFCYQHVHVWHRNDHICI
jgi:hypothetical protein